jgi:hypothetical protein
MVSRGISDSKEISPGRVYKKNRKEGGSVIPHSYLSPYIL